MYGSIEQYVNQNTYIKYYDIIYYVVNYLIGVIICTF
jgi:hypothetical protein